MCCVCAHLGLVVVSLCICMMIVAHVCFMIYCCSMGSQHEFVGNFHIYVALWVYKVIKLMFFDSLDCVLSLKPI